MMAWELGFANFKSYHSSTLKILSEEYFASKYLMIKAFEILILMWNWESWRHQSMFFFSPLIQTSLSEGKIRGRQGGRRREEGDACGEHLCECVCAYYLQIWMYLCHSCACSLRVSRSEVRDCLIFLNHGKQAGALLTMSLRVNAPNNFQVKNPLCREVWIPCLLLQNKNADPHSTFSVAEDFFFSSSSYKFPFKQGETRAHICPSWTYLKKTKQAHTYLSISTALILLPKYLKTIQREHLALTFITQRNQDHWYKM